MRQILLFISLAVLCFGLYLRLFNDVPDSQESINFFVSGFFIIIGFSSLLMNLLLDTDKKRKNGSE
jgi:hypothetical protein